MNKDSRDDRREQQRDRLADQALRELLGGERPPAASSERIVERLRAEKAGGSRAELAAQSYRRPGVWSAVAVALTGVAVVVLIGLTFWFGWPRQRTEVATGELERRQPAAQDTANTEPPPGDQAAQTEETAAELPSAGDEMAVGEPMPGEQQREASALADGNDDAKTFTGEQLDDRFGGEPGSGTAVPRSASYANSQPTPGGMQQPTEDGAGGYDYGSGAATGLGIPSGSSSGGYGGYGDAYGGLAGRGRSNGDAEESYSDRAFGGYGGESASSRDTHFFSDGDLSDSFGIGGGGYGYGDPGDSSEGYGGYGYGYGERTRYDLYRSRGSGRGYSRLRDRYPRVIEQPFVEPMGEQALSTVSIDVDTASYSNIRQYLLTEKRLPPPEAVRIEEMVNYFSYAYQGPAAEHPFAVHVGVASCPWQPEHRLVRVALKGRDVSVERRPPANLVFLVDVSGSMQPANKLPLVVEGLKELTRHLRGDDRVAIVVYASSEGLALPSTSGEQRVRILEALERLSAGGSTAGGAGIQLAYRVAHENFQDEGINRVILCTDGDFNVGVTDTEQLKQLVMEQAAEGVELTVLGFGRGNLNDQMLEAVTNSGNGNYYYIDNLTEARRVLIKQMSGTLLTIAKDVKLQVEFNPRQVARYRLLGYDNRVMPNEDFSDDRKDAGEIGAGHSVTFFYQIEPVAHGRSSEPLRYQPLSREAVGGQSEEVLDELLAVKLRYKPPQGQTSTRLVVPVTDSEQSFAAADDDFQFAAAVVGFGLLLKNSPHRGNLSWSQLLEIASGNRGEDAEGLRTELLEMIRRAAELSG